jgi:D-3-phosphoglycerate dehydrogenase
MNLKDYHVLVTPRSFGRDDPDIKQSLEARVGTVTYNETGRPFTEDDLLEIIPEVDGYIAGLDPISRAVLESGERLKVVARYGVGVDNVDLEAARELGVVVTNTPGANSASVAELTLALLLCLARPVVSAVNATRRGEWPRGDGQTLEGKTVGLIGFGDIGKEVARRLKGFQTRVVAYDIQPDRAAARAYGVELLPRAEVLKEADFLSLHCSLVPQTAGMVDAAFLQMMKPGAALINTARGELIDERALLEALQRGRVSGAALDVFSEQPPDPENPLLVHKNVLVTPHMAAHTDGATGNMGWGALEACLAVLEGNKPKHRVV